jgi:hypothetical protein
MRLGKISAVSLAALIAQQIKFHGLIAAIPFIPPAAPRRGMRKDSTRVRESRYSGAMLRQIRATGQDRECARRLTKINGVPVCKGE